MRFWGRPGVAFVITAAVLVAWTPAGAATVYMKDGTTVKGKVVFPDTKAVYVETPEGLKTIALDRVMQVEARTAPRELYRKATESLALDDADGHLALGLWAQRFGLAGDARREFFLVIGIDPSNEAAREGLGHRKLGDKWLSYEEYMEARGYVKFGGRWVKPEERARMERQADWAKKRGEWAKTISRIAHTIQTKGPKERAEAIDALLAAEEPAAAEYVVKLLGHRSKDVRLAACVAVGRNKIVGSEKRLVDLVLHDESPSVRLEAARTMAELGSDGATRELIAATRSRKAAERKLAAVALSVVKDPRAEGALMALLKDESNGVQIAAARAVMEVGASGASPVLLEVLLGDESVDVRIAAAYAFKDLAGDDRVVDLIGVLRSKSPLARDRAAEALAIIKDPRAVPELIENLYVAVTVAAGQKVVVDVRRERMPTTERNSLVNFSWNAAAHDALVEVSGRSDLGYSKKLWREWWRRQSRNVLREYFEGRASHRENDGVE
jgi:hypothetical protein